jgi:hypothetical protein
MLGALLLAAQTAAAASPVVVPGKAFVAASPAVQEALGEVRHLVPWDRDVGTVVQREGQLLAVRFSTDKVKETVNLPPFGEPDIPTVLRAACGDLLLFDKFHDNGFKAFLVRGGSLVEGKMWDLTLASASCAGDELLFFVMLPPEEESKGREPTILRVDLATDTVETLAQAPAREKPTDPLPVYASLAGTRTKSGHIWSVGYYSGQIQRLSPQGKKLRELALSQPLLPKPIGEQERRGMADTLRGSVATDPTKRQPTSVRVLTPDRRPLVRAVGAWGETLVLVTKNTEHPYVLLLDPEERAPRIFQLPDSFDAARAAVTADGVWFTEPLGLFPRELFTAPEP